MEVSDEKIIEDLKLGKMDSIEFIISKYAGAMKNYGFIHFQNVEQSLITDCITDTFLTLIEKVETFKFENEQKLKGWLFRIFKNLVYNEIDKRNTLKRGGDQFVLNIDTEGGYLEENTKIATDNKLINYDLIDKLLSKLKTTEKAILWYYAKGFKDIEIAELIGVSLSALKSKKLRALSKLRDLADEYK